jgi:hypothetical protein
MWLNSCCWTLKRSHLQIKGCKTSWVRKWGTVPPLPKVGDIKSPAYGAYYYTAVLYSQLVGVVRSSTAFRPSTADPNGQLQPILFPIILFAEIYVTALCNVPSKWGQTQYYAVIACLTYSWCHKNRGGELSTGVAPAPWPPAAIITSRLCISMTLFDVRDLQALVSVYVTCQYRPVCIASEQQSNMG